MNQLENILSQSLSLFILIPLVAFILTILLKNKQEKLIGRIVRIAKVSYIVLALLLVTGWIINGLQPISYKLATLYQTDHFVFAIYFYYDEITAVFSIVGSILFFLVATFSKYYMHRDEGFKRFFNIILLFAAGYNLIIFSGNFETLFIGWELKGLCSFLLIAFYRNRYLPVKNAYKTISNYRISDIALILAMWMMHHLTHKNVTYTQLGEARELAALTHHADMAFFIVCMFMLASIVKSAQFPFTSWLPRAMEGPTSSSAIFYGSLSVHVGVFLLLRTHEFWQDMLWAKIVIIVIGALTAIIATLIARVQPTVKTQIAYSSVAQIGIMFIEIAFGFHWLVLIHFAGNAFLRTYQLLVSPSVLNYLVHHQYFHYHPPTVKPVGKLKAALYILAVKEWNMDVMMYQYVWSPFKWIGKQLQFLNTTAGRYLLIFLSVAALVVGFKFSGSPENLKEFFSVACLTVALLIILSTFASRGSANRSWENLCLSHIFIVSGVVFSMPQINKTEVWMYGGGIMIAYLIGFYCLQKTYKAENDISLNQYHGNVYEHKPTALLFLIATIGLIGFPITTAFIGIDVFFTYVESGQVVLITLLALCFLFVELAAIRIFLRIYYGPHKKLYHPVAFRSS
jgi:NADH-quinone oxidoreductase subunit L